MDPAALNETAQSVAQMDTTGFLQVLLTLALALGAYMGYRSDQRAQRTTETLLNAFHGDPDRPDDHGLKGSLAKLADNSTRQTSMLDTIERRTERIEGRLPGLNGRTP